MRQWHLPDATRFGPSGADPAAAVDVVVLDTYVPPLHVLAPYSCEAVGRRIAFEGFHEASGSIRPGLHAEIDVRLGICLCLRCDDSVLHAVEPTLPDLGGLGGRRG